MSVGLARLEEEGGVGGAPREAFPDHDNFRQKSSPD